MLKDAARIADQNLKNQKLGKGSFIAAVYMALKNKDRFFDFVKWLIDNSLDEIKEISPHTLITIFEKLSEARIKQIFISMPFGRDDTEDHYNHIVGVINEINEESGLDIKIKPIRIDKTEDPCTFQIVDKIIEAVEHSGLLIADLTYSNMNVYHEIGYAMGYAKNKGKEDNIILIFKESARKKADKEVAFNLCGYSQLRFKKTSDLRAEIKKRIKVFYGLAEKEIKRTAKE